MIRIFLYENFFRCDCETNSKGTVVSQQFRKALLEEKRVNALQKS